MPHLELSTSDVVDSRGSRPLPVFEAQGRTIRDLPPDQTFGRTRVRHSSRLPDGAALVRRQRCRRSACRDREFHLVGPRRRCGHPDPGCDARASVVAQIPAARQHPVGCRGAGVCNIGRGATCLLARDPGRCLRRRSVHPRSARSHRYGRGHRRRRGSRSRFSTVGIAQRASCDGGIHHRAQGRRAVKHVGSNRRSDAQGFPQARERHPSRAGDRSFSDRSGRLQECAGSSRISRAGRDRGRGADRALCAAGADPEPGRRLVACHRTTGKHHRRTCRRVQHRTSAVLVGALPRTADRRVASRLCHRDRRHGLCARGHRAR